MVLGLGTLFVALAVAMTFPSLDQLRSATPSNEGDPFFLQWVLRWDAHALVTSPRHVLDASIFFPWKHTLLYSDTLLPVAPIAGLLALPLGNVLAFDLLYVASWVASLSAAYALARLVGLGRSGAVVAAIVATFAAPRLAHYGHFQIDLSFLIPLALWLLLRFLDRRHLWHAALLGTAVASAGMCFVYGGLMLAVAVPVIVVGWIIATHGKPGPRFFMGMLLAAAIVAVLTYPLTSGSEHLVRDPAFQQQFQSQADLFKARPGDLLAPAAGSRLYGALDRRAARQGRGIENRLFPGFLAVALGAVGLYETLRRLRTGRATSTERSFVLVIIACATGFVLAFGKSQHGFPMPYALLAHLPGFGTARGLARFMILAILGLGLLAGRGFDALMQRRPQIFTLAAAVVIGALMLAEYQIPIETSPAVTSQSATAAYRALHHLPAGPVVELPMGDPNRVGGAYVEPTRLLLSTIDWHPRVNGYSGLDPPDYAETISLMNALATGNTAPTASLARLRALGVRYLVVHTKPLGRAEPPANLRAPNLDYYPPQTVARLESRLPRSLVTFTRREGDAILIQLDP